MKRCPECRRDYYDETLLYCLDDGKALLDGPAERATAFLPGSFGSGIPASEAPTEAAFDSPQNGRGETQTKQAHQASTRNSVIAGIIGVALVTALGVGSYFYYGRYQARQIDSIAVMPFVNASGNADLEYFADGMTETLIKSLSQIPDLNVKARSSVFRYKGKTVSPQSIGTELNVKAVLTGQIAERSGKLALHLELVDPETENHIWSQHYENVQTGPVALQSEIAYDVLRQLRIKLSGTDEKKISKNYTENVEAYHAYLKGRHVWNKGPSPGYEKSAEFFSDAIRIDPDYALAYAGLADYYGFAAANGFMPPDQYWPKCEGAVNKAISLDESLADAYNPLAALKLYQYRDWPAAENAFRRGIELNPNLAEIRHHYGIRLVSFGRGDEGLSQLDVILAIDPLSTRFHLTKGRSLYQLRRYDDAIAQLRHTLELEPSFDRAQELLGDAFEQKGMKNEAVAAWLSARRLRGETQLASELERIYAADGFEPVVQAMARQRLGQLEQRRAIGQFVSAGEYAEAYARLGDKERALESLRHATDEGTGYRFEFANRQVFDFLRNDPRFQELVRKVSLVTR